MNQPPPLPGILLFPSCHQTRPSVVVLDQGRLWLACAECGGAIAEIAFVQRVDAIGPCRLAEGQPG